jgi:hypothetical protein
MNTIWNREKMPMISSLGCQIIYTFGRNNFQDVKGIFVKSRVLRRRIILQRKTLVKEENSSRRYLLGYISKMAEHIPFIIYI